MKPIATVPALKRLHAKLKQGHKLYGDVPPWGARVLQFENQGISGRVEECSFREALLALDRKLGGKRRTMKVQLAVDDVHKSLNAMEANFNTTRSPLRAWQDGDEVVVEWLTWEQDLSRQRNPIYRTKRTGRARNLYEALDAAYKAKREEVTSDY